MRFALFFLILVTVTACGKGNNTDKKQLNHIPRVGVNDPCSEEGKCQYHEYLSVKDPLVQSKFSKYFPNYSPSNKSIVSQYVIGQQYSLNKQGYFNQEFDAETGVFKQGCIINYDETRTVFRITHDLIDEAEDEGDVDRKYSEVLFLYKKENPKSLTSTTECAEFLEDFDDEDWAYEKIYYNDNNANSIDALSKLQKRQKY